MPSKKQALRDALREIDNTYDDQTGRKIPIKERMDRADAALNAGSGKGASTRAENDAAKVNTILKANQSTLEPIRDDIASISNAATQAGDAVKSAKNAYNALKPKFTANAGNYGSKSLIGQAARNLFEFPVFISTSVPLDYATAINSLLEQMYASYLQMTISYNPVITAKELAKGKVFQNLKTDITKYVEYTDTFWQHDACHNRIINDEYGAIFEFDMVNISAMDTAVILESANYIPLQEFDHFFMEAKRHKRKKGHQSRADQWRNGSEPDDMSVEPDDDDDTVVTSATKPASKPNKPEPKKPEALPAGSFDDKDLKDDDTTDKGTTKTKKKPSAAQQHKTQHDEHQKILTKDNEERAKKRELWTTLRSKDQHRKAEDEHSAAEYEKEQRSKRFIFTDARGTEHEFTDADFKRFTEMQNEIRKELESGDKFTVLPWTDKDGNRIAITKAQFDYIAAQNEENRRQKRHEEDEVDRERHRKQENLAEKMAAQKFRVDTKVKASQIMDESKIQKLNTMKPLMMTVGLKVMSDEGLISDMVDYVVGVRTHCRLVKADVLPDVAEFPLKEMNLLTRRAKWRAGEIKFMDFLFARKEKKQSAYDSRDVNRKWYHRLYTLAHSKGSRSIAGKITGTSADNGLIPNATIIMTKSDVDMINAEKKINLLKASNARAFCRELFLMAFIVVDIDAQSIKILLPDINNDFEVQSLASVQKQLATLDTSGTVSREVSKLMSGR